MFESIGPIGFSALPITSFFPAPTVSAPVTYTAPAATAAPAKREDEIMGLGDIFTAGLTGLGSALTGAIGGVSSLAKTPGLGDALTLGLGSLFGGGKSTAAPMVVSQTQNVNQATQVDVQNVLGGQPFGGGVAADGSFDVFKALGDVFKIRDAMAAAQAGDTVVAGTSTVPTATAKTNWTPILLIGGGALALVLLMGRKK